jgi:hypothetical protein
MCALLSHSAVVLCDCSRKPMHKINTEAQHMIRITSAVIRPNLDYHQEITKVSMPVYKTPIRHAPDVPQTYKRRKVSKLNAATLPHTDEVNRWHK